nr:hypothetical protein [Petrachloros mirabilis]
MNEVFTIELGVNSYIVKPIAFQDFLDVAQQIGQYWMVLNNIL